MAEPLTSKQRQIVELIAEDLTRMGIAKRLGVNENTVRRHVRTLCERYNCSMQELPAVLGMDDSFLPKKGV